MQWRLAPLPFIISHSLSFKLYWQKSNPHVRRYWPVHVCFPFVWVQSGQLHYQRLFMRVFLWIFVVWFMFADRIYVVTPSYGGWDGVMLVQYCVRLQVEIILFGIIAVKHLISHWTFCQMNIPALGFWGRGGQASKLHWLQWGGKKKKMSVCTWMFHVYNLVEAVLTDDE